MTEQFITDTSIRSGDSSISAIHRTERYLAVVSMSESKMLVRRILCLISTVFMLVISPASADASDLSGTWILSGIIYKNVDIPDTALADANEPEKEFSLVLEVEGDNDCRLILDNIAYSAQIDMISGDEYTVRIADNSCKLTCINDESALLHLSEDKT